MVIRHAYDENHQRCFAPSGSRIVDKMSVVVDSNGCKHLEKVGETDCYAYIQSFKDSVDLHKILERCALNGDTTELMKAQGTYGDYVGINADLRSLEHLRMGVDDAYNALDAQIKAQMTREEFLECFSTQEKFDALQSLLKPSTAITVESEVVNNEQKQ